MIGLILKGVGGFYSVRDDEGLVHELRAQAKIRRLRLKPLPGDMVRFTPGVGEENGWIEEILPRRNLLNRPAAANLDVLVVQLAAASPQPDLLLADRLLLFSFQRSIAPVLVVGKADLAPDAAREVARQYRGAGVGAHVVSMKTGEGIRELRQALAGTVHAFCGQSGVGKSTLINALYGLTVDTGAVSRRIERGRHTTRHASLYPVEGGGMVMDTPGFSLLESELCDPMEIGTWYPEFAPYAAACRFQPCAHNHEPGCRVREAVEMGEIDVNRWQRYRELVEEMRIRWRDRYD